MKVVHYESVDQKVVDMPGTSNCKVRWLVGPSDGAPNFAMRQFEVAPGGHTPRHSHPYEHEVFVLSGEGTVYCGDTPHKLTAGVCLFVAPDEIHQFRNDGNEPLKFLCLVPNDSMNKPITQAPECGVE
jgi:quercetin dioxygenase-like cupin family protein